MDRAFAALGTQLLDEARAAGLSPADLAGMMETLAPDPRVQSLSRNQPEHLRGPGAYLQAIASDRRIADGRGHASALAPVLAELEVRTGVPGAVLIAIWGIESDFGRSVGTFEVVRSLATLAAEGGRRAPFWRRELLAAIEIAGRRAVPATALTGSWAGAMGHTQFMPTTYLTHAVAFDGAGPPDIWSSVEDALASAANYLARSHWQLGQTWGFEVRLADHFDYAAAQHARPFDEWRARGAVGACDPGTAPGAAAFRLLLPAGWRGPAFLVGDNFDALLAYNNASIYALTVGHLADRIAGGPPLVAAWPDDVPLSRHEREEVQRLLVGRGYDTGGIDGILGRASLGAVRAFQLASGLKPDGLADRALLAHLRETSQEAGSDE